ncbi:MAG: hypothetical protein JW861_11625 [Bacteroidales bacterium]|nr:hypothetical protein [Bacteroidales bacterium]
MWAKISGLLLLILMAVSGVVTPWYTSIFRQFWLILFFSTAGYVFALFRPKEGGLVLIMASMILGLYVYYLQGLGNILPPALLAGALLVPGMLFTLSADRSSGL